MALPYFHKWESLETMFNNHLFDKHLMKTCLAAVFAIGLTACSSSDTSSTTTPPPDPGPTMQEQELAALKAQIAALRQQLGIDDSTDIGSTVAELQATLKELQDEAAMMAMQANAKEAKALFDGLNTDRGDDGTADLTIVPTVADSYGGTAMLSTTGEAAAPALKATDTAVARMGMWMGTELAGTTATATNGLPSNTAVVYTDVMPNTRVAFADVYNNVDAQTVAALLLINTSAPIAATEFNGVGRTNHDPNPDAADDVVSIDGMFDGAAGVYTCTAATPTSCASHKTASGIELEGSWSFNPADSAMVSQADSGYAYFGWWLRKDSTGPEVDTFHGQTDGAGDTAVTAIVADNFNQLGGTATYSGAAAGKYALNPTLPGAYPSGGHWTASATLTADFGDGGASDTTPGTISGMIDSFMAGGESMAWSVELKEITVTDATAEFSLTTEGTVWSIDGQAGSADGMWSGQFRDQGDNNVPNVVTGEFSSTYGTVGHLIGAFGTHVE